MMGSSVSEGDRGAYRGETRFPFILQNLHRWFLSLVLVFLAFLWWDAIRAFFFQDGFGIGVGLRVLLVNIILLTLYTFSCHSLRHWQEESLIASLARSLVQRATPPGVCSAA
jgi:hypothetical protein